MGGGIIFEALPLTRLLTLLYVSGGEGLGVRRICHKAYCVSILACPSGFSTEQLLVRVRIEGSHQGVGDFMPSTVNGVGKIGQNRRNLQTHATGRCAGSLCHCLLEKGAFALQRQALIFFQNSEFNAQIFEPKGLPHEFLKGLSGGISLGTGTAFRYQKGVNFPFLFQLFLEPLQGHDDGTNITLLRPE